MNSPNDSQLYCLMYKTVLDSFLITKRAPSYENMKHHFYNCAILKTKYSEGLRLRFAVTQKKL